MIFAPDFIIAEDLRTGQLIQLFMNYTTPETPVHAFFPHTRYLSAKTRTFIEFMASRFARPQPLEQIDVGAEIDEDAPSLRAVS